MAKSQNKLSIKKTTYTYINKENETWIKRDIDKKQNLYHGFTMQIPNF